MRHPAEVSICDDVIKQQALFQDDQELLIFAPGSAKTTLVFPIWDTPTKTMTLWLKFSHSRISPLFVTGTNINSFIFGVYWGSSSKHLLKRKWNAANISLRSEFCKKLSVSLQLFHLAVSIKFVTYNVFKCKSVLMMLTTDECSGRCQFHVVFREVFYDCMKHHLSSMSCPKSSQISDGHCLTSVPLTRSCPSVQADN